MLVPASPEAGHSWGTAGDKPEEGAGDAITTFLTEKD